MNLPNKLTVLRVILIPFFMIFILLPDFADVNRPVCDLIAAALFGIAAFTDFLDGSIARKRGIVTDFGKFMDPIADKLMVFGAFLSFMVSSAYDRYKYIFAVIVFIVLLREFAVTSIRMLVNNGKGKVIAANMSGKIKTCSQIVFILLALLERHIFSFSDFMAEYMPLTCVACITMLVFTIISGATYIIPNISLLNTDK